MTGRITKQDIGEIHVIEYSIRGWLENGIHPKLIATALNNAFCHGEAMHEGGFWFDDSVLGEIFEGIEKFASGCGKVE